MTPTEPSGGDADRLSRLRSVSTLGDVANLVWLRLSGSRLADLSLRKRLTVGRWLTPGLTLVKQQSDAVRSFPDRLRDGRACRR